MAHRHLGHRIMNENHLEEVKMLHSGIDGLLWYYGGLQVNSKAYKQAATTISEDLKRASTSQDAQGQTPLRISINMIQKAQPTSTAPANTAATEHPRPNPPSRMAPPVKLEGATVPTATVPIGTVPIAVR